MMKLLIQGCGFIGEVHLRTILENKLCEVSVCEANDQRRRQIADRYGIETYPDLTGALRHHFDGAVICTPNHLHYEDAAKCIGKGLNIMLEKPISTSAQTARQMMELSRDRGRFIFVAYCLRFAEPYRVIREYIASGRLGKVFGIRASAAGKAAITDALTDYRTKRALGGGVISDFSHEIDYTLWFAGESALRAACFHSQAVHREWDVPDTAEIMISCSGDIVISIHMDYLQPYAGRSIEVYGDEASIRWRDNEKPILYDSKKGLWTELEATLDFSKMYRNQMEHYLDCLENGKIPLIGAEDGYQIMRIVDKCMDGMKPLVCDV